MKDDIEFEHIFFIFILNAIGFALNLSAFVYSCL